MWAGAAASAAAHRVNAVADSGTRMRPASRTSLESGLHQSLPGTTGPIFANGFK